LEFALLTAKSVASCVSAIGHMQLLLAGSYRFSYEEVAEDLVGQVPGVEVASGGKAASASNEAPVYI